MRSLIIGAAAFLAIAVPGIAAADTGGSLRLTYASIDDEAESSKDNVVALSGVVITDLQQDNWRLQFNGSSADVDFDDTSYAYSQAEVHATYDAGQYQLGVFTGMANLDGYSFYEYGVEAAVNFERGQIAVSAAGATSANEDFFDDFSSIAASGTFNLNDSWSVGATLSTTDFGNWGSGDNVDSWGVNVAYAIPDTDFTIGAGYRSSDYGTEVDFVGVSLTWGFGEGRGRAMPGAMALIPDAIADE